MRIKNKRIFYIGGFFFLLIILPCTYLGMLQTFLSKPKLALLPGWVDNNFDVYHQSAGWLDDSFEQGWNIVRNFNEDHNSSGFSVMDSTLILYTQFEDISETQDLGISGIVIGKNFDSLNTNLFPFLVIKHRETTSNPALVFSFEITDSNGMRHYGQWYHTSSVWTYTEYDLRKIYNGTIRSISIKLTNDFDPTYVGGVEYSYIQLIAIYSSPTWRLAYNKYVNAELSSKEGVLTISANGNLTYDTIVSAERFDNISFNPQTYRYLKVSIKTSSVTVAARIVLWANYSSGTEVLVKTYNDTDWHTEIVEVPAFGFNSESSPFLIELGFILIDKQNYASASYKELSFNKGVIT